MESDLAQAFAIAARAMQVPPELSLLIARQRGNTRSPNH
jgi:hypothetical protein